MSASGYGLGIDIGSATVRAAACTPDDERLAEPLRLPALRDGDRLGALLDRVGDPVPLYVDGHPRTAADAVAAVVAEVAERVTEHLGAPAAHTVVTVPPSWTEHRRSALADALHGTATLASSAVAVTRHGRATGTVPAAATVAVYDLGASTLDTAVVRADDGDIAHVAPPPAPLPWGGRDVDDAVVRHVRGFLPTTPTALRSACVAAKEALSARTDVRVEVGDGNRPIRLVREDLDELLTDAVAESVAALRTAVTGAGLDPGELDAIVLAGGSARLPAVAEALSAELGRPVLMTAAPELAAACGAAELALDLLDAPAVPTVELVLVADEEPTEEDDILEDEFPEEDEDQDEDEDQYEDEDDELAQRRGRLRSIGSAAFSRAALVAALFVAILATPVTLLATLDSGVLASHGGGAASAADSPAATSPPAPDSPAAATGPAGTTSASSAHGTSARSSSHSTKATTKATNSKSNSSSAAHSSTAAGAVTAAAAAATAPTTAAVVPVDATTATTDPGTTTPAPVTDPAPVVDPPAGDPPPVSDPPPSSEPPASNPPPTTDPPPATNPAPPPADTPAPPPADPPAATP